MLTVFAGDVVVQVRCIVPILYSSLCTQTSRWSFGVGLLVRVGARDNMFVDVNVTTLALCNILCAYFWCIEDVTVHVKFSRNGFDTQGA
jgi:hypothetical protein